jgi:hypothetical protein
MAWTSLASRLSQVPLVIAGPMLRQVTKNSVTVWVALQQKTDVTLTVYDSDTDTPTRKTFGTATRTPAAIGKNLFIVAVTVRTTEPLVEGKIYFYDLKFTSIGPPISMTLAKAITKPGGTQDISRVAVPPYELPSFALPPADLNKLRLIQGSCRKPNGGTKDQPYYPETPDAFGMLDQLIADDATDAYKRPHQLLLTGDQIYADEVADVLLAMLMDASQTLMGWTEQFAAYRDPNGNAHDVAEASTLKPSARKSVIWGAAFTTQDTRSHLMALGEYLAMYLFAWSDELFIATPTIDEFKALYPDVPISADLELDMFTQRNAVEKYREALPKVRRALANIPSYMICDDHEVTDDWNMTRFFCDTVYANRLGTRIIQNGLCAFAICQAWGNLPEQFWPGSQAAGTALLTHLEKLTAQELTGTHFYHTLDDPIRKIVGLHNADALAARSPYGVFHDLDPIITVEGVKVSSTSLRYNFTVEGPSHQVIVTDSRTWRQFPVPGNETHGDLIGIDDFKRQIHTDAPPLGDRLLLIVCTTNIPPTVAIREAAFVGSAGNMFAPPVAAFKAKKFIYDNDILDSWEFPAPATERVFAEVSNKFPKVGGVLTGQAVFLSGDVHFSFASRLAYWAEIQRLGDPAGQPQQVKAVYAQLVASALKNEKDATRGLQRDGYGYTPKSWQQHVRWPLGPAGYVGWNVLSGKKKKVAKLPSGIISQGMTYDVTPDQPTVVAPLLKDNEIEVFVKPDYRYRLDYLGTVETGQTTQSLPSIPAPTPGNPKGSLGVYAKANSVHLDVVASGAARPEVVGFNSISEISFVWRRTNGAPANSVNDPLAINRVVSHKLRWVPLGGGDPRWARYDISLWVDDNRFPKMPAHSEP